MSLLLQPISIVNSTQKTFLLYYVEGCSPWAPVEIGALSLNNEKEVTMPATKVKEYLDSQKVEYTILEHSPVYTAQEAAASAHIPGRQLAKTVMIKLDGEMAMVVLPAAFRVNFDQLKKALGVNQVELATEKEFKDLFPDCEVGATPPFGHLYGMEVIADESLSEQVLIAFCAGSHTELVQLSYADFEKLAKPKVIAFALKT
jgi:Ala-tRNA(Pro) deacylase